MKLVMNELSLPAEKITITGPDTALTPPTGPTTASRQTYMTGKAVVMAAQALKEEITSRAADHLGCAPSEVKLMDDKLVNTRQWRIGRDQIAGKEIRSRKTLHSAANGSDAPSRRAKSDRNSKVPIDGHPLLLRIQHPGGDCGGGRNHG